MYSYKAMIKVNRKPGDIYYSIDEIIKWLLENKVDHRLIYRTKITADIDRVEFSFKNQEDFVRFGLTWV